MKRNMGALLGSVHKFIRRYRFYILLVLGLRVGYSVWLATIWLFMDKWFLQTENALWETYYHLTPSATLAGRAFLDVWLRWDAVHYMNIAAFGYQGVGAADTVYFPFYPYFVGGIARITGLNLLLIGILASSLALLFALICLHELVIALFQNDQLARWSAVVFALYPTAFFFHAPYTDAFFLAFSLASILMMVKRRYISAGLLACAAGITRTQGLLLLIPMIIFYVRDYWKDKQFLKWRELVAFIITPMGSFAYIYWRQDYMGRGIFESLETYSGVLFQFPIITMWDALKGIFQQPDFTLISELVSVTLFLIILIWMFTRREFRQHLEILLYSAATWLLITSKTTISASPLQSSNRYVLHVFFAFVGMAWVMQKWSQRARGLVLLLMAITALLTTTLYALWIFVG